VTAIRLVRHGETEYNADGILQGGLDIPLNDTGVAQANALMRELSETEFAAIYSSPLKRAFRTAEVIAEPHEVTVSELPAFRERSYGELEGKCRSERTAMAADRGVSKSELRPDGGENCHDVVERALPKLDELARTHPNEQILVVAHGALNRSILSQIIAGTPEFAYNLTQDNTGVNRIQFDDAWRVVSINNTSHLSDTPSPYTA